MSQNKSEILETLVQQLQLSEMAKADVSDYLSPPYWTFRSDELAKLEVVNVFRNSWQLIGHISQLKNGGDYLTLDVPGIKVFVILGEDGVIRAFNNLCTHRLTKLIEGETGNCKKSITCPYHGWAFNLDGTIKSIPWRKDYYPHVTDEDAALTELKVEIVHGLIFVCIDGEPEPISKILSVVKNETSLYSIETMSQLYETFTDEMDANWKIIIENDFDAEHITTTHPAFMDLVVNIQDLEGNVFPNGLWRALAQFSKREKNWTSRNYKKILPQREDLPERYRNASLNLFIYPNLSIYTFPDRMDTVQIFPINGTKSIAISRSFAHSTDDRRMKAARYLSQRFESSTFIEDIVLLNRNQSSMTIGPQKRGVLSKSQDGQTNFYSKLYKQVPVSRVLEEPAPALIPIMNRLLLESYANK